MHPACFHPVAHCQKQAPGRGAVALFARRQEPPCAVFEVMIKNTVQLFPGFHPIAAAGNHGSRVFFQQPDPFFDIVVAV